MTKLSFKKFNNYLIKPDMAYRLLLGSSLEIYPIKNYKIKFLYLYNSKHFYETYPYKAIMMLESIYPRRARTSTSIVSIIYNRKKAHAHCQLILELNGAEFFSFIGYYINPAQRIPKNKLFSTWLSVHKYYAFPGYIRMFQWPRFNLVLKLSLKEIPKTKHRWFMLQKAFIID